MVDGEPVTTAAVAVDFTQFYTGKVHVVVHRGLDHNAEEKPSLNYHFRPVSAN